MAYVKTPPENDDARHCNVMNANYLKVLSVLEKKLHSDRPAACRCVKCISDITALALNCLPPHYYVDPGRGGEIGSPLVMVESAVSEAIETVVKNPRH